MKNRFTIRNVTGIRSKSQCFPPGEQMKEDNERLAGILMHITSLPSPGGIGDMGPEALSFIDFLASSHASLWQILPLGPTGYGDSPYAPRSSFAGNELLISLQRLHEYGLVTSDELAAIPRTSDSKTEYGKMISYRIPLLLCAASRFIEKFSDNPSYLAFKAANASWLEDYCTFMVISRTYNDQRWNSIWPEELGRRDQRALAAYKAQHCFEIEQWAALQYLFDCQWKAIKSYANSRGISIIGDIPIFVAPDSADAWSQTYLFKTDPCGQFSAFSGVPPDLFSKAGQFWGNPVYDWERSRETDYRWWKQRIARQLELCDILRIDHFRGFESYWEIPAGRTDAVVGSWIPGPGAAFFKDLQAAFPSMKIVAEDLGFTTPEVIRMLKQTGFPGMKIALDGFSLDSSGKLDLTNPSLPCNYPYNSICYPGTHDNDTIAGWYGTLPPDLKSAISSYYGLDSKHVSINEALISDILESRSHYAVIPMQDLLGLGSEARMNTPATCSDRNWSWRMLPGSCTEALESRIAAAVKASSR
ncbi:MAG: 4-alpha-glucanotransferase [Sphaerochaetaceae bacterium]|nr:4-alpha-glucanotransferase [Sphaerochaetaceae bacterium]MDD3163018.1 4-alpha-glucanotransferase [Sphaerochaetaceae bacterium]MDD4007277.1 4-alpha-glucanotransferase [Sphaerochaetaceae bacterium]MDD4396190.1 4-alpha-glucanotransferase [Sphaerochaetaceae bacterium]